MLAMAEQGRRRAVVARVLAAVCLFLSLAASAWALSAQMQQGLNWLTAQVKAGGALNNETTSKATTPQNRDESLRTLQQLAAGSATPDVSQQDTTSTEYLARQALSLSAKGSDVSKQLATLVGRQNADGGFGLHASSPSASLYSAWALAAFAKQPTTYNSAIGNLETWLYGRVQSDGGLDGYSSKDRQQASSLLLLGLETPGPNVPARNVMQQLSTWLSAQQAADGSWGEDLYLSAYALSALIPVNPDTGLQQTAVTWLLSQQAADGSWNDDPFLTAVILRALAQAPAASTASNGVSGQILAAGSGQALVGVSVSVVGSTAVARSDSHGNFRLTGLPAGSDNVQFAATGYQGSSIWVTVPANGVVNLGGLLLQPANGSSSLSGFVTSGITHQPIAGATVTIAGTSFSTSSSAQGYYQFASITGASVSLSVSAIGYSTNTATVGLSGGAVLYQPVLYPVGAAVSTGNAQITGRVLAQGSNQPLANVQILVNQQVISSTDSAGNYTLSLAGGSYSLSYRLSGFGTATAQLTVNQGDVATLQTVYLTSAQATTSTVAGVITDSVTGQPVIGATVQIVGGASTVTDSSGNYTLSSGNAGSQFSVRASDTGYNSQIVQVQVSQPTTIIDNFSLVALPGQGVSIAPISTSPNPATLNTPMTFATVYQNSGGGTATIVPVMQVVNAAGKVVSEANAFTSPTSVTPLGVFNVPAGGSQNVYFQWNSGTFPPGNYKVYAYGSSWGSFWPSTPIGSVFTQQQTSFSITAQSQLAGSVSATPPVQQLGNGVTVQPVQVSAELQNTGNIPTVSQTVTAQLVDQSSNKVVASLPAVLPALAVQQVTSLDLGTWSTPLTGSFMVNLLDGSGTSLGISTTVYIGAAVSGVFSVTPSSTASGKQTIKGQIALSSVKATLNKPTMMSTPVAKIAVAVSWHDKCRADACFWLP
jgi:hypothetical protein